MRPELFLVSTTNNTSLAQSCCVFCSQAEFKPPLAEAVRRKRGQVLHQQVGYAQHRRNQEAVEQADPDSVQTQMRRDPHRDQEEHGQEQQERRPRAQQRLCGLMNPAWATAESALRPHLRSRATVSQESSGAANVDRRAAQSQGEQGNLQHPGRVEEPAVADLKVRHILQDGNKAGQQEDVEDGGEPQEDGEK